ncbi:MAG: hypothetical protein M3Z41_08570 [Candidatus Eremiobacteraeota bacterium]|nr:hypothetical protein [Candidatus Eremiobacteraeota bacterium]
MKRVSASLFIIVGALLVLVRPCRMTWGFFLFALGSNGGTPYILQYIAPPSFDAGFFVLTHIIQDGLGTAGFWMFASRFPSDVASGWRLKIDRWAPLAGLIASIAGSLSYVAIFQGWRSFQTWVNAYFYLSEALLTVGMLTLIGGYFRISASERQRLKWVVGGFAIYLGAVAYVNVSYYLPGGGWPASWVAAGYTIDILNATNLFIPATVVYAVLKHHVLDINFVISRALVFGTLTTALVGILALVDWFFEKALVHQQFAIYAEVGVALGFGFGLNGMHRRVEAFIDRVLFRRRHLAEARLKRIAAGISHAVSSDAVDASLVTEPADAFQLTSAAVFRRQDSSSFVRATAVGWPNDSGQQLHPNDPIILHMQGERGPMRLRHVKIEKDNFPSDAAAPIIAFPLLVRHQLEGLALYGAHVTGEDIDPDETRMLERLSTSAAAAYDHIEAQDQRAKFQDMKDKLDAAQGRIDALMASQHNQNAPESRLAYE